MTEGMTWERKVTTGLKLQIPTDFAKWKDVKKGDIVKITLTEDQESLVISFPKELKNK